MVSTQRQQFWQALNFAWTLGYTIAIPLVVFALLGRFLDKQFGTEPWLLIGGVILSMVASTILVVKRSMALIGRMAGENPPKSREETK